MDADDLYEECPDGCDAGMISDYDGQTTMCDCLGEPGPAGFIPHLCVEDEQEHP